MKTRNDYKVYEDTNRKGEQVWRIRAGGINGDTITTSKSKEAAIEQAQNLNIDPYFYERGQTRADRIAAYNVTDEKKKLTNT